MRYEDLIRHFERVVPDRLSGAKAERAMVATLATLAECLPAQAAHDLAEQLPGPLRSRMPSPAAQPRPRPLTLSEFLAALADREGVSPSEALGHARATFEALTEAATGHELLLVRARLPPELAPIFDAPAATGWPDTHRPRPHP